MKILNKFLLILVVVCLGLAVWAQPARADSTNCASEMASVECTIEAGETFNGDISMVNSTLVIEKGGRLNGMIEALQSEIVVEGWVTGEISAALGSLEIRESAHVNGDINTIGAKVEISENATLNGDQSILNVEGLTDLNQWNQDTKEVKSSSNRFVGKSIWLVFVSLSLAALALVSVLIFQRPAERMMKVLRNRPLVCFALGLLFVISLPFAITLMSVTIVLIPVVIAVALALPFVLIFSWVAAGSVFSKLIADRLGWDWAPAVQAAIGTLVLTFVTGLLLFVPCVGWVFLVIVELTGLGAFVLLFFRTSLPAGKVKASAAPDAPTEPPVDPAAPVAPIAPAAPVEPNLPTPPATIPQDLFPEDSEAPASEK